MSSFARNLRMLLGVHDLDAGAFARRLSVSPTSVSYWLNARREPSADHLLKIAESFQVTPQGLLRSTPEEFVQEIGDPERFAAVERELVAQGRVTPIRRTVEEFLGREKKAQ